MRGAKPKRFVHLHDADEDARLSIDLIHEVLRGCGIPTGKRWEIITRLQMKHICLRRNTEVKPILLEALEAFRNE